MDLNLLFHFTVLAQELNLTKAAQKLYLTQSTLSRQMDHLEQQLDVTLFERNGRFLRLTEAGNILRSKAPKLLDLFAHLQLELQNAQNGVKPELCIASFNLSSPIFNEHLRNYRDKHGSANISLTTEEPDTVLQYLLYDRCDLAFTTMLAIQFLPDSARQQLDYQTVCTAKGCAVVSPDHHLANRTSVSLSDLERESLITIYDPSANQNMNSYFNSCDFHPKKYRTGDFRTVRHAVNYGKEAAILLDQATFDVLDNYVMLPISDCDLDVELCFAWQKDSRRKVETFINMVTRQTVQTRP